MGGWRFSDDYGATFPALAGSYLDLLVFSAHALKDGAFTGTIDFTATGTVPAVLAALTGASSLAVAGSVVKTATDLTVTLAPADAPALLQALAARLPIVGGSIRAASLAIHTELAASDTPAAGPRADSLVLGLTLAVGSATLQLSAPLPLAPGTFTLAGTSTVSVGLGDLKFLMGRLGDGWFPSTSLGPFYRGGALTLLGLSLVFDVSTEPAKVTLTSVSAGVGIGDVVLIADKLDLSPFGVWVLVRDPGGAAEASWSVQGTMALRNAGQPARVDLAMPFVLDLSDYSIDARLSDGTSVPFDTILQDVLGAGMDVGLSKDATLTGFALAATADKASGKVASFTASLAASEPFGCFKSFGVDLQQISLSVAYSA